MGLPLNHHHWLVLGLLLACHWSIQHVPYEGVAKYLGRESDLLALLYKPWPSIYVFGNHSDCWFLYPLNLPNTEIICYFIYSFNYLYIHLSTNSSRLWSGMDIGLWLVYYCWLASSFWLQPVLIHWWLIINHSLMTCHLPPMAYYWPTRH